MLVPTCHCGLTEVLLQRLHTLPESQVFAVLLEGTPVDGTPHIMLGADLAPLTRSACTQQRLLIRCRPAFADILADFGLDTTLPEPN